MYSWPSPPTGEKLSTRLIVLTLWENLSLLSLIDKSPSPSGDLSYPEYLEPSHPPSVCLCELSLIYEGKPVGVLTP